MVIVDAAVEAFRVALRAPVATARGTVFERRGVVVVLRDDGGCWGRGEAAPLPGWSTIDLDEATAQLEAWSRATAAAGAAAPADELAPEVAAAVDVAVRSLAAAAAGVPLWRSLGAESGVVRVASLVVGSAPSALADHARAEVAAGATVLKTKLGMADDAERLRVLAEIIGRDVRVRLDANGAWSVDEAVERLDMIADVLGGAVEFVEDPVAGIDGLEQLASRRHAGGPPIAADEAIRHPGDATRVASAGLAEVIVVKPPMVGGIGPTLALAAEAGAHGVDVVVSSLYDGPVGLGAWLHLAAALPGGRAHGLGTAALLDGDFAGHLVPVRGLVDLRG
ncbi:MAG: o-succinylbenzoate synthase [Acidimicrobiales bacterium]